MKVYIIMHKGAPIPRNLDFSKYIRFAENDKIWAGDFFWRLKDAKRYLDTLDHKEYRIIRKFELVSKSV